MIPYLKKCVLVLAGGICSICVPLLPGHVPGVTAGDVILAECKQMLGWPYDRGKCLFGRVDDAHPSNNWSYADEGWHLLWGEDGLDNDLDGLEDEMDEHFVVCTDLLVIALARQEVEILPLMEEDFRRNDGKDYRDDDPMNSKSFFPRRVRNLEAFFLHTGRIAAFGGRDSRRLKSFRRGDILFTRGHLGIVSETAAGRPAGIIHASYRIGRVSEQPLSWHNGDWWHDNVTAVGRWEWKMAGE